MELAVQEQLQQLPRKDIAAKAFGESLLILVRNETEAMELLNAYAAEHLIPSCSNASTGGKVINAGSVFIGNYSPESGRLCQRHQSYLAYQRIHAVLIRKWRERRQFCARSLSSS